MRLPRIEEIERRQVPPAPILQAGVRLHIRRDEGRRADGGEVLGGFFVVPQLLALDPPDLDAEAPEADVVDVGLDVRPRPREAHPAAIGFWRREQAATQILGQIVAHDELAAHETVRLGVAGALEAALREVAHKMAAHLDDHGLDVVILAGLRRLLGETDVLAAAGKVDERGEEMSERHAQRRVEGGPQERLLDAPFEVQKYLEQAMQKPQEHPAPPLAGRRIWRRSDNARN